MPFSRIPGEAFNEADLKDPKERGFGDHREISNHLEGGSVLFLGKESNQMVPLGKEGHFLRAHDFNEVIKGDLAEFYGLNQVKGNSYHAVYPREKGTFAYNLNVDPVVNLKMTGERCWVLGDARDDGVSTCSIDDVGVHPVCRQALPFLVFPVP
jgi:hypothetical protein